MANATTTNIDTGRVVVPDAHNVYKDQTINFAGSATYAEGTILARRSADSVLVPFVAGGAGGAEIPRFVLPSVLSKDDAGDVGARVLTSGKVNASRLVIHADGDGSNLTEAILDSLRSAGIESENVTQLGKYDNAAS